MAPTPAPPQPSLHYFLTFNELSCRRTPECQEVMRADGWINGRWGGWEGKFLVQTGPVREPTKTTGKTLFTGARSLTPPLQQPQQQHSNYF